MEVSQIVFRTLSLNCWAIAIRGFQSKLRKERIEAIAEHLGDAAYEIVALQEIWNEDDYVTLRLRLSERLPFSHYFYSGYTGSGLCVFSKYPILETMWHAYPLSGYAHKFQHADWYGAKGVGLCKLKLGRMIVHVYTTHVHARHSVSKSEEYLSHRTTQMLNLAQFVRHTSDACDAALLCGDLNTEDGELGYRLLLSEARLKDAWVEKHPDKRAGEPGGETSDKPNNPFVNRKSLQLWPHGARLDYVMYRQNEGVELACIESKVTMGQIPGRAYFYSDHEAVLASFLLKANPSVPRQPEVDSVARDDCLRQASHLLDDELLLCQRRRMHHAAAALLWLALLVIAREQFLVHEDWHLVSELVQVVAAIMAAACGWSALVLLRVDSNSLRQHKRDVENLLSSRKHLREW